MQINFKSNLVKKVAFDSSLCFLRMPRGVPFVITRAEGTKGFPAMLRGLMWRANFSYALEYFVYTTRIGPNLVECYASVLLHPHLMTGLLERSHIFSSIRSSTEAAIQASAYSALTSLRMKSYTQSYRMFELI